MIYELARSALFALDAERSHELTLATFAHAPRLTAALFREKVPDDPVTLMGLTFRNRVGLAAGLDKNGECIEGFSRLGFGFIEVGTVTPRPQPGNLKPRLFRLIGQSALINRLGFNNKGVAHLVEHVRQARYGGVLGINIGKNFDTPLERAADDYVTCLRKVFPFAGYVAVNISSPNTPRLRDLQSEAHLRTLLARLREERRRLEDQHARRVPLLLKIAPDLAPEQINAMARTAIACGMDGMIATNTTVTRPGFEREPLAAEPGGLSGAPLKSLADDALRRLRAAVGPDYPLIGVGGVMSGADAAAKRAAGADLVQIYTGFIYRGPRLIAECARACRLAHP